MTNTAKRDHRKLAVLCLLVVLLLAAAAFGTMAWLTASDSVTNTFTVGNFNKPNPDPGTGPDEKPLPADLAGYIVEPNWNKNETHKLIPGASFAKDPYVGIGPKSEDAIVYVYVQNPFEGSSVYFELGDGWSAVEGETVSAEDQGEKDYVSGLFKYTAGLTASASDNVWTANPVFSQVVVSDNAQTEELNIDEDKNIVVSCFIHQAKDGDEAGASLEGTALDAAKYWVNHDILGEPEGSNP